MPATPRIAALDRALRDAGIPIHGVSRADGVTPRIDFRPEATAEQQALAASIAAAHDFTPDPPDLSRTLRWERRGLGGPPQTVARGVRAAVGHWLAITGAGVVTGGQVVALGRGDSVNLYTLNVNRLTLEVSATGVLAARAQGALTYDLVLDLLLIRD